MGRTGRCPTSPWWRERFGLRERPLRLLSASSPSTRCCATLHPALARGHAGHARPGRHRRPGVPGGAERGVDRPPPRPRALAQLVTLRPRGGLPALRRLRGRRPLKQPRRRAAAARWRPGHLHQPLRPHRDPALGRHFVSRRGGGGRRPGRRCCRSAAAWRASQLLVLNRPAACRHRRGGGDPRPQPRPGARLPGRPALTAERFLPTPRGGPATALYRTGDLGALPAGRRRRVPRPDRPPGQDPRLPHRARARSRRRWRAYPASRRRWWWRGERPSRRLRRLPGGGSADRRAARPARLPGAAAAGATWCRPPSWRCRLCRSRRTARWTARPCPRRAPEEAGRGAAAPARPRRGAARRHLGGPARARAGRRPRRLLRAGRPLPARHPPRLPGARRLRRRAAAARPVRGADARRAGRPVEGLRRGAPGRAADRFRCRETGPPRRSPSPSSGSGSWTSSSPGSPAYNLAGGLVLAGDLDAAALAARLARDRPPARVAAHRLRRGGRRAVCQASPRRRRSPPLVDLAGLPEDAAEAGGGSARRRRGAAPVRPRPRAAPALHPAAPGRARARAAGRPCTTSSRTAGRWGCWCAS